MRRNRVVMTAMCFAKLVAALKSHGGTTAELADEIGIRHNTALNYIRALKREKLVHIGSFGTDRTGRQHPHHKIWKWGNKPDAVFVPVSHEEFLRRKREERRRRAQAKLLNVHKADLPANSSVFHQTHAA